MIDRPSISREQAELLLRVADECATDDDFECYAELLQSNPVFAAVAQDTHFVKGFLRDYFKTESKE